MSRAVMGRRAEALSASRLVLLLAVVVSSVVAAKITKGDFPRGSSSAPAPPLTSQLRKDCEFLESEGIMDYSFLVGVHFCDDISASEMGLSTFTASPNLSMKRGLFQVNGGMPELCFPDNDFDKIPDYRKPLIRLGAHMPARAEQASKERV